MKLRKFAAAALTTVAISAGVAAPASAQTATDIGTLLSVMQGGKEAIAKLDCGTSANIQRIIGGNKEQTRTQYANQIKAQASGFGTAGTIASTLAGDIADKALECKQVKADPAPRNPLEAALRSSSESPLAALLPSEITDLIALSSGVSIPN